MAGILYEVLGNYRFVGQQRCPDKFLETFVKVKGKEDEVFEIPAEAAWVSGRLRQALTDGQVEDTITVDLSKDVIKKMIEFLKHHKDYPSGEIRTPLMSDDLVECGCSKWDANFVKVDKDKLFDLLVASSLLDVPALFFACYAQVTLLYKEKELPSLKKQFKLTDDFSREEEEALKEAYNQAKEKKRLPTDPEVKDLAQAAVFIQGVAEAADKHGVPKEERERAGLPVVKSKGWRRAHWCAAVAMDWKLLHSAPEEICNDSELMTIALTTSRGLAIKFAGPELRNDEDFILEALKYNQKALAEADSRLRGDRAFVAKAARLDRAAVQGAAANLQEDSAFLLEMADTPSAQGSAFQGAATKVLSDEKLILEAVGKDPEIYKFASKELRSSKDFALQVARANGLTLEFMSPQFRADMDIVTAAVRDDSSAKRFAHASRQEELGVAEGLQTFEDKFALLGATVQLTQQGPRQTWYKEEGFSQSDWYFKAGKFVQYSAGSTFGGNMGQSNYVAANCFLDKLPFFERPEVDGVALMWGAVGSIGMRWKAFASADFLNATPEALLQVNECCKIITATAVWMFPPEWYNCQLYDQYTREAILRPSAGFGSGGGFKPSEIAVKLPRGPQAKDEPESTKKEADLTPEADGDDDEVHSSPLGGWPALLAEQRRTIPRLQNPYEAGARVRLVDVGFKSGRLGTLVKQVADGKWKVQLDDGSGTALLKSSNLQVMSEEELAELNKPPPPPPTKEEKAQESIRKVENQRRRKEQKKHRKIEVANSMLGDVWMKRMLALARNAKPVEEEEEEESSGDELD